MITSASNARLKLVRKLAGRRQREKLGLFVCEGEDLVEAALEVGIEPVEALVDAERPALADLLGKAEEVEPALMAELSTLGHPPRVIAVFRQADLPRGFAAPVGLGLWHIGDPGNLGTVLRTADALGPAFVALSRGSADPTAPKSLRASAGAVFRVPIGSLDEAPRPWFALVSSGGQPLWEAGLGEGTFVLGAEREGLPPELLERCEERVTIPQEPAAESLNVAVAGALALYELRRRRLG